jgi:large subunit ribosomal protein L17
LRNQVADLFIYGSLTTTEAKAKLLKSEAERIISRAKVVVDRTPATLAARRRLLAYLPKRQAFERLLEQIVPQFKDRAGGYVRVVKLPPRKGDYAPSARVEFVVPLKEKKEPVDKKEKKPGKKKEIKKREKPPSKGGKTSSSKETKKKPAQKRKAAKAKKSK